MTPYYEHDGISIYLGDCREVLPTIDPKLVSLVLTDPPYGVGERTDRKSVGRDGKWPSRDFPPIHGDNEPFDPTHLLRFPRLILFGANHYANKLPPSNAWIVWDKLDGLTSKREIGFNDNGDAELAWTNLGGPVRLVPHRWAGLLRASETYDKRLHPTQKPVALMARLIGLHTGDGELVLDPYMGSGSTLRAAKDLGRRCIGVEIEERYCEIAARRLEQGVLF